MLHFTSLTFLLPFNWSEPFDTHYTYPSINGQIRVKGVMCWESLQGRHKKAAGGTNIQWFAIYSPATTRGFYLGILMHQQRNKKTDHINWKKKDIHRTAEYAQPLSYLGAGSRNRTYLTLLRMLERSSDKASFSPKKQLQQLWLTLTLSSGSWTHP